MEKRLINIAILEPSQVIYEGLSNIFLKSGLHIKLYRLEKITEMNKYFKENHPVIFIINPSQIQNKVKEFISIKKNNPENCWVGLIYALFDQQIISLFDKIITITDAPGIIIEVINRLNEANSLHTFNTVREQLSERETEVLKLIISGMSNKEIADKLFISIHTVVSHRKNISQKTGIKSQSGLTIYAISNKIINLEDYT